MSVPTDLALALDAAAPRLGPLARRVAWFAEISSTNDRAAELAVAGVAEGAVVIAESQTAGRGRLGRSWCSPPGAGLYVSVLLRPPARATALLTLAAGVAIADGVQAATGLRPDLKWPNDIWVGGRKLGGILAEAGSSIQGIQHVVLGFGLNISPGAYPSDVAARATSLEGELGRAVERGTLLAECLAALATRYEQLCRGEQAAVLAAWRDAARPLLRRHVEWDRDGRVLRGLAEDVDSEGALLVQTPSGRERIIAGEVRWNP